MHARTICLATIVAISAACAASKPHTYGSYADLAPKVSAKQGERVPQHITVDLAQPANVAVFLVVPGRASQLLFPADSTQSPYVQAGSHEFTTSLARVVAADSARGGRRGGQQQPGNGGNTGRAQQGRGGRGGALDPNGNSILTRGYLLVYASPDSLPYQVLATRVNGISIPIDDSDALNTVTKLIRETTHSTGKWAAYATEFAP